MFNGYDGDLKFQIDRGIGVLIGNIWRTSTFNLT
jgi:hypothetical protein